MVISLLTFFFLLLSDQFNRSFKILLLPSKDCINHQIPLFNMLRFLPYFLLLRCSLSEVRVLLKYKEDGFLNKAVDFAVARKLDMNITSRNILAITVKDSSILEQLQKNEGVINAEIDQEMKPLNFGIIRPRPDIDLEITPYGIEMVQANELWSIPEVDEDLRICVVDTGIDLGHPVSFIAVIHFKKRTILCRMLLTSHYYHNLQDLPTALQDSVRGTNTGSGVWIEDGNGHGTHTAGTIGAVGENGKGVVGVRQNPNLYRFHIGKGLTNGGSGFESDILDAVQGCVDNGARVISMSLGGPSDSKTAREFYQDVYDEGVLLVAAAGNDGNTGHLYPASYGSVMSVAAIDENKTRPEFSQCNNQVEISGPGVDVLSTVPRNKGLYGFLSGTSMACPHVAGVAAEVWARFPDCTNVQIRNVLLRSAIAVNDQGCNNADGSGLVQAKTAYDLLEKEGCTAGDGGEGGGGCRQNPDFVEADNSFLGECPSGASSFVFSALVPLALFIALF